MTEIKPGQLANTLDKLSTGPHFAFYSPTVGGKYDSDIVSVTMRRGKTGRGGGVHPSTMEITFTGGPVWVEGSGSNGRLFIRDDLATALGAQLGVSGTEIAKRFEGRLGQIDVEDTGLQLQTTYSASSWVSQLSVSPRTWSHPAGTSVKRVIQDLLHLNLPTPPEGITGQMYSDYYDTLAEPTDKITYSDAIDKFTTDLGILVRVRRDGFIQGLPLEYRRLLATNGLPLAVPITRSEAISPARWTQRNEVPASDVSYYVTTPAGAKLLRTADIAFGGTPVTYDWSYVRADTQQTYYNAMGIVYESNPRQMSVPSVKIDLLRLIDSPSKYHRDQAGQLLLLEAGDPIFLSDDWPPALRGVHFAEGIAETITGSEWTIELSLVTWAHAMGSAPTPEVPPRAWESAHKPWNAETRTWNQS